jgi:hypothetical protein
MKYDLGLKSSGTYQIIKCGKVCAGLDEHFPVSRPRPRNTTSISNCTKRSTVQFPYLETCGVRKWGKTKEKRDAGCEASTYFVARDVSEKYQCQIHLALEHQETAK